MRQGNAGPRAVALAILTAALAAGTVLAGPRGARLAYRLKPRTSYVQTMETSFVVRIEAAAGAPAAPEGTLRDLRQSMKLAIQLETAAKDADGGVPFESRITAAAASMAVGDEVNDVPGAAKMVGLTLGRGRVEPAGREVTFEMAAAGPAAPLPPDFKDRMRLTMPPLPDRGLSPGESFTVPLAMGLPPVPAIGGGRVSSQATFTLKAIEGDVAHFDVAQTFDLAAEDQAATRPPARLEGSAAGTASFDRRAGHFSRLSLAMSLRLTTQAHPTEGPRGGRTAAFPISAVVEGPVTFTMAAAPP